MHYCKDVISLKAPTFPYSSEISQQIIFIEHLLCAGHCLKGSDE